MKSSAQPSSCLKPLIFVVGACLLLCVVLVVGIKLQRTLWIAPFEQRFASTLTPLPSSLSADTILPAQVESFQRTSLDTTYFTDPIRHSAWASYSDPATSNTVSVSVILTTPPGLNKLLWLRQATMVSLGPDNVGGWSYENTSAKYPFSYASIIGFSDRGVITLWLNNDSLLSVSGERASILEFLDHYPY